jgi:hypothetical protein
MWLTQYCPQVSFVRYADDIVANCNSKTEAEAVLEAIRKGLAAVKLQIKEEKTRIAYYKDYRRKAKYEHVKFEFLGYSYQPRARKSDRDGNPYIAFTAEISPSSQKKVKAAIREEKIWSNITTEAKDIAKVLNAKLRG